MFTTFCQSDFISIITVAAPVVDFQVCYRCIRLPCRLWYLHRDAFKIVMFVLWMILGIVNVCFSTDEDRAAQDRENDEKFRRAARKRFGKWAWPVRLFGAGLAVAGAVLVLFRVSPPVCLLLIFAGLAYTTAVEHWLKGQAERENENAI